MVFYNLVFQEEEKRFTFFWFSKKKEFIEPKNPELYAFYLQQMKLTQLLFFFFGCSTLVLQAQENCAFKPQNKKGGHYLFSTFYEDDLKTPCEGVCQILHLGKIYERRTFVKGRLTEETLNTFEGNPRVRSKFTIWDNDSINIDQKVYYENGLLQTHNIYYLNQEGRRCLQTVEYGLKG